MRRKSIYLNLRWTGILLMGMGLIFLSVAIGMQFITIDFDTAGTITNESIFRLVFLLSFGLSALILIGIGLGIFIFYSRQKRKEQDLRNRRRQIIASNLAIAPSNIRVNMQYQMYLTCTYQDARGQQYIFKSRLLRFDPLPFLNNQVTVYYDPDKMSRYFVDVDASMQNVYEL